MRLRLLVASALLSVGLYAQNPVIPMTAITGTPQRSDVAELLVSYKEVGIDQFLIYPRSGLEIEYMSDDWFRLCRDCIELADSLDMKVWLYDEYNWPSGNCRGAVTSGGREDLYPKVLLFDNDGNGNYTSRVARNAIGADILDPEAVARFIAFTHERYYEAFAPYFGRVIRAMFTDEPSFSYTMSSASGMLESNFTRFDNDHFALTWYDGLEADYEARCGRDLHQDVIDYLHGRCDGSLWTHYYNLLGDRMRTTYIAELSAWCEAHGISLTGHLQYEKLYKSVRCNGNALKMLSCFGIPGFDEANSDIDINAREMEVSGLALTQYARQGKAGAMCELYSVGPADNPMSLMRQLMWMCAAFGIDSYVSAVSAMDARGNVEKGDWYFPSGPTQPWFDFYREFCREAATAAEYARKPFTPEVRVRVPSSWFMSLDKTPEFERQGLRYLRFLEGLLSWQLQFMLLDEDEDLGNTPVLSFGPDGFSIEGEDLRFDDVDEFFGHVCTVIRRGIVVKDRSGKEVRDVLARLWDDGSVTLVDLTDDDRSDRMLEVTTSAGRAKVRLQGHGAYSGKLKCSAKASRAVSPDMSGAVIIPDSMNLVRCTFLKDRPEFRFRLEDDLDIRILARTGVHALSVCLDGAAVETSGSAERLPYGFRNLYSESAWIHLSAGEHLLSMGGEAVDYRYLSGVFIEGAFTYDRAASLLRAFDPAAGVAGSTSPEAFPDYVGSYCVVRRGVSLPACMRLDTNLACAEVLVDGESLGRRAWGPFEWDVPARFRRGRHELRIRIYTSVMPMFGDLGKLEAEQPYVSWLRIKPGMHGNKTETGVFSR